MSTPTMQQIAAMAGLKPVEEVEKHTPGPWRNMGNIAIVNQTTKQRICTLNQQEAEAPANANLIAAAPDLLEACRDALIELTEGATFDGVPEALKAAIAKAEGKRKAQSGHATITLLWFVGFASAAFLWMLWSLMKAAL